MLNTARTTCLVGLVDVYQTELYQDSTNYNELEKSRLLMNFFFVTTRVVGTALVVTLPGAYCYTLVFVNFFNNISGV